MVNKLRSSKVVLVILIVAFLVRLYGFAHPIADWHSWRQADTSAVSRNFIKKGYDILHPRFDDLSNVASGKDNPQGYRYVEFPIYNLLQAGSFQIFGVFTLEEWGRIVTIISSLLAVLLIYLLVKRFCSERAGLLSASLYGLLPYDIYYGRVILPDPSMATASLAAVYFFSRWIDGLSKKKSERDAGQSPSASSGQGQNDGGKWVFLILSMVCASLAFLLKPYAVFFLLPIPLLAFQEFGWKMVVKWQLWVFAAVSVLPLLWWRQFMTQFPEGIPANTWLLNGNGIRFRPAFFRWIGYERLTKLISGYAGLLFLLPGGIEIIKKRDLWVFLSLIIGSILYVTIFATGNVQHDYYQILIMPTIAIVMGIGAEWIVERFKDNRVVGYGLVLLLGLIAFYFSWQQVKGYFYINNPSIVTAGKVVDQMTPKDAKIVALYDGDTSFLYQTNRQGWPSLENGLPDLIKKGADYLVFANPTPDNYKLGAPYKIVAESKEYVLFDLKKPREK